jgi:tRNA threonylcarbamoyladenosine biosynthesis protein TsaB
MSVLAIDTSSRGRATLVVAGTDGSPDESAQVTGALLVGLGPVLRRLARSDITAVVVATGPGTYTGLRAGMAAALGIAHARGVPLHGISSLEIVAAAAPAAAQEFLAVADAGRDAVYAQRFAQQAGVAEPGGAAERLPAAAIPVDLPAIRLDDAAAAAALRRVIPRALSRPALDLAGISATYLDIV